MAEWFSPTEEQRTEWAAWVAARPPNVRTVAERFFPWKLYRLKTGSGHQRVFVTAFDEENDDRVTLRIAVTGQFNLVAFERQVFGIDPKDLEECELPEAGEPLGSANLSIEEARELFDAARERS